MGIEGKRKGQEGGEEGGRRGRRKRRDGLKQRACPGPARLRSSEALSPTVRQEDTRSPGRTELLSLKQIYKVKALL